MVLSQQVACLQFLEYLLQPKEAMPFLKVFLLEQQHWVTQHKAEVVETQHKVEVVEFQKTPI